MHAFVSCNDRQPRSVRGRWQATLFSRGVAQCPAPRCQRATQVRVLFAFHSSPLCSRSHTHTHTHTTQSLTSRFFCPPRVGSLNPAQSQSWLSPRSNLRAVHHRQRRGPHTSRQASYTSPATLAHRPEQPTQRTLESTHRTRAIRLFRRTRHAAISVIDRAFAAHPT